MACWSRPRSAASGPMSSTAGLCQHPRCRGGLHHRHEPRGRGAGAKGRAGAGGAAPAEPLKVLGAHPDGGEVQVMPGKYGPYVKWEKVNATLPKDGGARGGDAGGGAGPDRRKGGQGRQEEGGAEEGGGTVAKKAPKKAAAKKAPAQEGRAKKKAASRAEVSNGGHFWIFFLNQFGWSSRALGMEWDSTQNSWAPVTDGPDRGTPHLNFRIPWPTKRARSAPRVDQLGHQAGGADHADCGRFR
jgi:hypothetical protein